MDWSDFTYTEQKYCESVIKQSDEQLRYALQRMENEEFNSVKFFILEENEVSYVIKKQFFVDIIVEELEYREAL